jgi:hypothetical protein
MGGTMITQKDIDDATMHINGTNIADFGVLVEKMSVGAIETQQETYQGVNRTNFNVLDTIQYMRSINVNLFYSAPTRRELALIKSKIDNMMIGKLDLWLPDGFYYSAHLVSAGEENILGVERNKVIALCAYQFKGIRHDKLETVQTTAAADNKVYCKSTVPHTDCRLICTASQNYASLQIDTVTITNVSAGDVLVVDGITGRILQNGGLCAGNMSFIHFPSLVPDENTLTCVEDLTVEYYPTY